MFLGNDGLEGSTIKTLTGARQVAELLREHTTSMRKKMGLTRGSGDQPSPPINLEFLAQFSRVVDGYIETQDALAAGNLGKAAAAARDTLSALSSVDMALVKGNDHMAWMEQASALKGAFSKVVEADALNTSRAAFSPLSKQMMTAAKRFGAPSGPLYQFRCPMALGGEGATWVQTDKETRNPYLGQDMLRCGGVIDALSGVDEKEGHDHD